jgi:hypothetical protein
MLEVEESTTGCCGECGEESDMENVMGETEPI